MKNPRTELDNLIAALQRHLEVASVADSDMDDSSVLSDAEEKLRDAFFTYDDALFTATGVELPFDILEDDDEEYDDDFIDDLDDDDEDDDNDYLDEGDLEDFDLHGED
ncbi:DNA primase [Mobiluncus curtisii]|uniref:DNA primase n=1 Tax=Mobiluncus curtisii TaxID=2051 RepID=A0A7Y0UI52_9ACTO|nr:DNA primase [Mobiluncus curtisii]MCU9987455.1 DNA primase [Mobiluncus curtisii]NMW49528.1 DNA primase [Mobiluncus curtisii]NMW87782.1 DNA primase [Mobiluncus curtisii]